MTLLRNPILAIAVALSMTTGVAFANDSPRDLLDQIRPSESGGSSSSNSPITAQKGHVGPVPGDHFNIAGPTKKDLQNQITQMESKVEKAKEAGKLVDALMEMNSYTKKDGGWHEKYGWPNLSCKSGWVMEDRRRYIERGSHYREKFEEVDCRPKSIQTIIDTGGKSGGIW